MSSSLSLVGLAYRARMCVTGDEVIRSIQKKRAKLVLIAEDCGENMKKKMIDKCTFYKVDYDFVDGEELNRAMGTANRKSVAILDEGFAQKIHTCLKG